jgi:hypothetical protein
VWETTDWTHLNGSATGVPMWQRANEYTQMPMLKLGAHDKSCTAMKQSNTARKEEKTNNL